jgi:hypothetical protein
MKRLLNSIIISAFLISLFISFNTNAQNSNISSFPRKITQSKLFIETNMGINGNTHVGMRGDDGGIWNGILNLGGELGIEGQYIHKSGFVFTADLFWNGKEYGESNYNESLEDRAQQSIGKSIGIGIITEKDALLNGHLGILSVSFGNIHSVISMDGDYESFGDIQISGNDEKFFNDNYFLDFNYKIIGHLKNRNIDVRKLFFSKGLQLGVLTGVNKSNWIRDSTREMVPGLNRTFPLSFYLKFSFGVGVNPLWHRDAFGFKWNSARGSRQNKMIPA